MPLPTSPIPSTGFKDVKCNRIAIKPARKADGSLLYQDDYVALPSFTDEEIGDMRDGMPARPVSKREYGLVLNTTSGLLNQINPDGSLTIYNTGGGGAGFPLAGNVSAGTHLIQNLGNGVAGTDAVNKGQLDAATVRLNAQTVMTTAPNDVVDFGVDTPALITGPAIAFTTASSGAGLTVANGRITNTSGGAITLNVNLALSAGTSAAGSVVTVYIAKNGAILGNMYSQSTTMSTGGAAPYSLAVNGKVQLANTDYVEGWVAVSGGNTTLVKYQLDADLA